MMRYAPLVLLLLTGFALCSGCSASAPEQSQPENGSIPQVRTDAAPAPVQTDTTAGTISENSEAVTAVPEEPAVLIPAPEISRPDYQGGDGGEEHAETPLPEYFTYRFYENGFSARLAGGMYQALEVDLSAVSPLDAEQGYYLCDSDYDGDLDLSVPVLYTESQKRFAVFLWDSGSAHFAEEPVILTDPQYFPDAGHLTAMEQNASEATVTDYVWENGTLTAKLTAHANAETLSIRVHAIQDDGEAVELIQSAEDEAAMTEMLLRYYHRKTAVQAGTT